MGPSLVQRSPSDCGVSLFVIKCTPLHLSWEGRTDSISKIFMKSISVVLNGVLILASLSESFRNYLKYFDEIEYRQPTLKFIEFRLFLASG